jgi:hypothetical protein
MQRVFRVPEVMLEREQLVKLWKSPFTRLQENGQSLGTI